MIHPEKPSVLCLMGPTSSGKTDLALALAKSLPIEIINVDSAQIYQGMDIGSGKPSFEVRATIPHHLMDFLDPAIAYSAAQFQQDALSLIQQIKKKGKIPLLVGGTMMYFNILKNGISTLPTGDPIIREKIASKAKEVGWPYLHQILMKDDPVAASKIKPNDQQRISRALEIKEITGENITYWQTQPIDESPYSFTYIGLTPLSTPRSILHERIENRFDAMLSRGLVQEVEKLKLRNDLDLSKPSMRAVGYRQVWQFLQGEINYDEMRNKAITATRQLAKRQLTWLRSWSSLIEYDFQDPNMVEKITSSDYFATCVL